MSHAGLYIHVPFCRAKCPYCDFYSLATRSMIDDWLDALLSEMHLYKGQFGPFDTVYLGGGTPSMLPESRLVTLMKGAFHHFTVDSQSEISIEANPKDLTREKGKLLKNLGFNRVTVGVQSFDDRTLSFLGRRHSAYDALGALSNLRSAGFENIGIDLIYGLPGQGLQHWLKTLEVALSQQPEHLSCYQLTIAKGTVFWRMKERGEFTPIGEDPEQEFFCATASFLESRGYVHYEISNFAKDLEHACRHNQKYWDHTPYLGLGPSAHSYQDDRRWWNLRSIRGYCRALKEEKPPVEGHETLSTEQVNLESVALGLRTRKGFDRAEIRSPEARGHLLGLEETGFLRCEGTRVIPTRKGFLVAEHLPLYLCGDG